MVGYCYPMMLINSLMRTDRYILQEDGFKQRVKRFKQRVKRSLEWC